MSHGRRRVSHLGVAFCGFVHTLSRGFFRARAGVAMGVTMALILGASVLAAQLTPIRPLLHAEGVITAVDGTTSVSIRGASGEVRLQLTRATTIFVKGRTGTVEDLKAGDTVRGAYERGGGLPWLEVLE
jgi:hypothetical protein